MPPYYGFGRPRKYQDPEALRNAAEKYFNECAAAGKPFTIGKLCSSMGITRDTLMEYHKKSEFTDTVNNIRAECEADQEARLVDKEHFTPGLIFSLKNNSGWKDKTEVDSNVSYPTGININFIKAP
jgi:hypothetical protein